MKLIAEQPDKLQMQLQVNVTVAAAEAAGELEFGRLVRAGWEGLWDTVRMPLGGRRGSGHELHGARNAHQHPLRPRLPARAPGLGGLLSRRQARPRQGGKRGAEE
ncbi:hypothetical protein GCM10020254_37340 [Streptomyces goshikiensis]